MSRAHLKHCFLSLLRGENDLGWHEAKNIEHTINDEGKNEHDFSFDVILTNAHSLIDASLTPFSIESLHPLYTLLEKFAEYRWTNTVKRLQTILNYFELWRPCRQQMPISNKTACQMTRRSKLEPGHYSVKYSHIYFPQRKSPQGNKNKFSKINDKTNTFYDSWNSFVANDRNNADTQSLRDQWLSDQISQSNKYLSDHLRVVSRRMK